MDLFKLVARLGLDTSEYENKVKDATAQGQQMAGKISAAIIAKGTMIGNALTGITAKAMSFVTSLGQTGLTYNQQMEDYTTNFKVMLGSMEAAEAKVDELKVMAAKTPFAMEDLADATQTLLAFGVQSSKTTSVMKQLGDISLGNAQRFSSLSNAYGKAAAQGKLTGEVVQMMVDAGFNPLLLIAQETGEAMTDLQDRMSRGAVSVDELDQALRRATSEGGQFYNGMEEASKTISGQLATLSDNWDALLGKAMEPVSDQLSSKILPTAIESIDRLTNALFGTEDAADAAKKALFLDTEGNTIDPSQNLLTWYDDLMATWTDGKVEDTATVAQFVEEFNKNSESIKTALQTRINDLANPLTEEEMAAASAKITEISNMQTEIDRLLVKRAGGYFTAEDEARLKEIVEQLGAMQLEVENSANFETNVVSPWERLMGVLGEYSEDAITGITDFLVWTLENGELVDRCLSGIGSGLAGLQTAKIGTLIGGPVGGVLGWLCGTAATLAISNLDALKIGFDSLIERAWNLINLKPELTDTERLMNAVEIAQSKGKSYSEATALAIATGGYATGLEYVPYNDFPARLHEGEAVLTKLEAQEWRAGGSTSPQSASIDYEAMASAMVAALASSGIGFNVDSRQLAQATADANSRAQAQRNRYINIGKVRR